MLRPHAGRATVSAVVLYDHRENFLQLKTFSQPVSRARVRVSLLNDPQSLLDGWRRQAFRWHVLGPDLETAPETSSDQPSRHHVLCGLPEPKARYFEHWAAQAGLNVELEAVVPYALAAFCWLRDAVRTRVAAGAPCPAFFGLVAGHDHAWLGYWDGQKYAFLADQDRERLHAVGEALEEIRAEFSGRARAGEPADHPPLYLVARTEAELTALREALSLDAHVPVAGLGSPVLGPAPAASPRERGNQSGDGPALSWPGLSLGPEPEAELLGHVLNLL